ncbi:ABC transporter permease [Faunimonas sp. B44]|uniref:ABC transporter permease n=1 Tax=Faunimonas sp. B44 TaxID=3461493 RepID=UPI004043EF88
MTAAPRRSSLFRGIRLRRFITPLILIVGWQGLAISGMFRPIFMPPLDLVAARFVELLSSGILLQAAAASLATLFAGFFVAVFVGIAVGLLVSSLGFAEQMAVRFLSALLATPAVAWTPLFLLWFGLGAPATIALIIFVSSVPIALNTWSGIRNVDRVFLRVARSMGVTGSRRFFKVVMPAAFASILTGLRLGFARGWHALVAGELLAGASVGLGVLITRGRVFLDTPTMIVGVLGIALFAYVTERMIFERVESRMLRRRGLAP